MGRNEIESHGLTYDVFISFRGEDTRHKFIGHLRKELFRRGINAFLDDKHLELGLELLPALSKAIQESRIFILVFSPNYASSTWCLDELRRILQLSKTRGNKNLVFPIFYHVDPLDVQHQRNSYKEHMMEHEQRFGTESQKVRDWRSALSEVCNLVRDPKIEEGSEIDLIENIVKKVYENITLEPLDIGRKTVGLGPRIEELKSLLDMNLDDNSVRMLGVHGFGGVGKTELAKALYDEIVQNFDAACFLADVREKSNKINGLEDLQKTLLSELYPKTDFEDVSSRAVGVAKRLPLALKVIGSDLATLRDKSLYAWERALEEYEKIHPNEMIQEVLKTSYDRLHDNSKQVFLDIACFFKGEKKEYVKRILEEFGSTSSINVLCDKSLLTIEDDCLKMHDLIQDMGREIVRQEAPNYPGKRSRLWDCEDVREILTEDSGSKKIQGIMFDPPQREEVNWSGNAFEKMKWLRILIIRNTTFSPKPEHLPNHLRVLDWEEYPSKSFQSRFHPKKIIVFNMPRSHLTLEGPFKNFSCLTNMDFSDNQSITELPDVSQVQNLRELRLDLCGNLIAIHYSVGFLKRLVHLSASECSKLSNFPRRMFLPSLEFLDLNLCGSLGHFPEIMQEMSKPLKIYMIYTGIEELPESIGNLTGLVYIDISNSRKLQYLPSSLFMLPNVVSFKIEGCSQLREFFRRFIHTLSEANVCPALRALNLGNCNLADEDLEILRYFPNLEDLIASENNFTSLPTCIDKCVDLISLDLSRCIKLKKIPKCTKLRILDVNRCYNLEDISELPSTIQKVDARYCHWLSEETSNMLWSQVAKGIRGIEVMMPFTTEFPEWFHFVENGANPHFWAPRKFPNIALGMVFQIQDERRKKFKFDRHQVVHLQLHINGQFVPRKRYYSFRIEAEHVLICDLRVLFSDEEWLGLDALLEQEWNLVQVLYQATSSLSVCRWGVFVDEGTNMEDVQFNCPDLKYSEEMSLPIVPMTDPMEKYIMMIGNLGLGEIFKNAMNEYLDNEEKRGLVHDNSMNTLLGRFKTISEDSEDALNSNLSALENPNSILRLLLDSIKDDADDEKPNVFSEGLNEVKDPVPLMKENVGEASTSDHQGSSSEKEQDYDPLLEKMKFVHYEGMRDGLLEAKKCFPSLDIDETLNAVLNKGIRITLPPEGESQIPYDEIWTYTSRKDVSVPKLPQIDWTNVIPPDPLFLVMKRQCPESQAESRHLKKMEEHQALRNRFVQLEDEKENAASDNGDSETWKNRYDKLIQKLNTQSGEFVAKKLDCSEDLESASTSTDLYRDNVCKCVTRYEKVNVLLKGRAEELRRLYYAGIEGYQNSEEFQDLMSAVYWNGLGDGVLEAQAISIALWRKML
ncbi:unnamed protein product [Sphenostylis stenocarpa]|uniref:TIR domain-containing protein n=1 Tax=Sphenostylis stenocarpa TaxID=92480 RepID=A0AA86SUZ6_9FABA|nr:unnamed protein product [Sphenostylis stenocarpa]